MLVTSKTRSEVEPVRRALGNHDPFIVENGGAAFLPAGSFPFPVPSVISGEHRTRSWWLVLRLPQPEVAVAFEASTT